MGPPNRLGDEILSVHKSIRTSAKDEALVPYNSLSDKGVWGGFYMVPSMESKITS